MTDGRGTSPPVPDRAGGVGGGGVGGAVPAVTAVAVTAVTVLVLLLAVWAASTGPDDAFRSGGPVLERVTSEAPVVDVPSATPDEPASARTGIDLPPITSVIGYLVLAVAVLSGLAALWLTAYVLSRLRPVRLRRRQPEPVLPPLEPAHAVAAVMVADAEVQEALLAAGTPRNAVVQCWHRFEVQAAEAGLPRRPWETSAEFTLRVLELVEADATSVTRLSELYREARCSEHELSEDTRDVALEVLRDIHRDLRVLVGGRLR